MESPIPPVSSARSEEHSEEQLFSDSSSDIVAASHDRPEMSRSDNLFSRSEEDAPNVNGLHEPFEDNAPKVHGKHTIFEDNVPKTNGLYKPSSGNSSNGSEHDRPFDDYDWDDLQHRYDLAMEKQQQHELELQQKFDNLMVMFKIWAAVPSTHVQERASKRLKTRISFVQQAESDLEGKRDHYVKVVEAFQVAMELLKES